MPVCINFGVGFLVVSCVQREWVVEGCGLYGYFSEQGLPVVVVVEAGAWGTRRWPLQAPAPSRGWL